MTGYRRVAGVATIVAMLPLVTGCGVMMGGTTQAVTFNTTPPGVALTTVPPSADAKTPTTIKLERKHRYTVTFSMAGYQPAKVEIERKMRNGILVADILLCCLAPIIDAITGGWYKLTPDAVNVSLVKSASIAGPETIRIGVAVNDTKGGEVLQVESSAPGVHIEVKRR
jgi:hypothetical protein